MSILNRFLHQVHKNNNNYDHGTRAPNLNIANTMQQSALNARLPKLVLLLVISMTYNNTVLVTQIN